MQNYNKLVTIKQEIVKSSGTRYKFIPVVQQFIKAISNGEIITPNGKNYSKGTIRTYKTFLITIQEYEAKFGTIFIDDIDITWANYYRIFLTQKGLTKNTIGTNMARLKAILNRAYLAGITKRSGFGIKVHKEETAQVYLSKTELQKIYHFQDLTPGQLRVRDIFIMHCFTGMRISDYLQFIRNPKKYIIKHDEKTFIKYYSKKTQIESVCPMPKIVQKILEENEYYFGSKFTYQHYNYYLKTVMKKIGIDDDVICVYTKGGEPIEEIKKKYEMISSHTARRTFASLAELSKINRPAIMRITGHKTEQSFLTYIRISKLDSALSIYDHEFFSLEL